ncbi:importin alpha [Reticulomyxa filosa]|uniref:Importin subunit alpha n=1 Tax=Reticulomyxa filosa TaxID=46433 RepID=X6MPB6_RETFI|nr:importin alpha [Reticulomyxa filosa]|eukprot:ETO15704.1 importin alpha [Reticulomyxa filosa]
MFNDKNASSIQRDFQKGLDMDEKRRSREEERFLLRKQQRSQILKKRRVVLQAYDGVGRNYQPGHSDDSNDSQQIDKLSQETVFDYLFLHNHTYVKKRKKLKQLDEYVKGCQMDHEDTNYKCCLRIRQLLSIEKNPPTDQFEAAWALTNIASGSTEHTACVIRHNAIPAFVQLIETTQNEAVFEQALWALGNISGDSPECRNLVLDAGGLTKLIPRLEDLANPSDSKQTPLLRTVCWTLSNFCRGKPPPPRATIQKCVPALIPFLDSLDEEILQDATWAFSYLTDNDDDADDPLAIEPDMNDSQRIDFIQTSDALPKLVNLLSHSSPLIQHPVLRCIGNMVTGNDEQTQVDPQSALSQYTPQTNDTINDNNNKQRVLNCGMLKKLSPSLESSVNTIRKEACWTVSNITATNSDHVEQVIQANLIHPLIFLLTTGHAMVRQEAAWALSNATSIGTSKQVRFLVGQGLIPGLVKVLLESDHERTLAVALEAIRNICELGEKEKSLNGGVNACARFVEEGKGIDALEELQTRKLSEQIIDKAEEILRNYFEGDDKGFQSHDEREDELVVFNEGNDQSNRIKNKFEF